MPLAPRKLKKMADGGGVHEDMGDMFHGRTGQSAAGMHARRAQDPKQSEDIRKFDVSQAKDKHREKLKELQKMPKIPHMAEGGEMIDDNDEMDMISRIMQKRRQPEAEMEGPLEESDLTSRIMHKRSQMYSEGGRIANEQHHFADESPNDFDDLALRDDLEFHDTGANSGDELGDSREEHDRSDIVARVMASRRKKDRMPRPA